jgi:hypothetical protein
VRSQDPESALKSVSGADFKLQDALAAGTMTVSTRKTASGDTAFDYSVEGPQCLEISLLTNSRDGRLFAIFVSASPSAYAANAAGFKAIRDSFMTYDLQ